MPIGVWSTSSTRVDRLPAFDAGAACPAARGLAAERTSARAGCRAAPRAPACSCPSPRRPSRHTRRPSGSAASSWLQVVQGVAPRTSNAGSSFVRDRAPLAAQGWSQRLARGSAPVIDAAFCRSAPPPLPCATTSPPRLPAPGPMSITCSARRMVSSSCSTTTSVLPLARSLQRVEQHAVVARVQADGRLVEHVANALQVRCRAAPPGGCAAPRRRTAWARRGPGSGSRAPPARGRPAASGSRG